MVVSIGVMPAFILRCDKASIRFQGAFFDQLGLNVADFVFDMIPANDAP